MEQPWNQQREGVGYAMGESSCHAADVDQAMTDPCEVDGALLMELIMEDMPSSSSSSDLLIDGDVDRQLSRVIRSLEAEIIGAGDQQAAMMMSDDGGESLDYRHMIEDMFSDDMDGYDYEGASSFLLAGHDESSEGWCLYTNTNGYEGGGVLVGYDTVDLQYYCCAESSADHMYLPLWE